MSLQGEDFHNASLTGPRASHAIPDGGTFSAYASAEMNASPEIVYNAILDVGTYREWNSFVDDVTITKTTNPHGQGHGTDNSKRLAGGTCMIFHSRVVKDPEYRSKSREVVTLVEDLKLAKDGHSTPCITRIRWRLDNAAISTPGFLLKAERTNEIEETADKTTIYRTWETFSGPVSRIIKYKFEAALKDRMTDWCNDLKAWCENSNNGSLES